MLALAPHRFLNTVYFMVTRNMEEKDKGQFDFRLDQPLKSGDKTSERDAQGDLDAFDAFAAAAT